MYAAFGHAIAILSKLQLFAGDGWDQEYARSVIDFSGTIDMLFVKFEEVKAYSTLAQPPYKVPEVLSKLAPRMQVLKDFHEMRRAVQSERNATALASNGTTSIPTDDEISSGMALPFGYDLSGQDFMFS